MAVGSLYECMELFCKDHRFAILIETQRDSGDEVTWYLFDKQTIHGNPLHYLILDNPDETYEDGWIEAWQEGCSPLRIRKLN